MKKIDIFTIAALTVTLLPVSCQMEEPAEELTYTVNVPIVFGDNPTTEEADAIIEVKADVDGTSGVTTWTTGDQIAYYVSGPGANKYRVKTINGTIVPVSLTSFQSRGDFAVYPPASVNATYHTAANLKVKYPTTYDFSGMTALQMATFSPLPMVGDNTQPNIVLYNVGGLLRLTVNNVPAAAKYIKVTVPGMNITGDYTVYTPTSTTPSVTATTGSNDNVTFQIAETSIGTQGNYTVNLPLPAGDYSGVTGKTITVEALNESSSSIAAANGAITHWTTLGRRKGKKLTVDFAPASFAINEGEATIWKSQTANFTTNATAGSVTWNSSTPTVATVNASGTVTGVSAGYTDITATLNGIKVSDPVRVYVNAVTAVTLDTEDSKYKVAPGSTKTLVATLTHTTNGAVTTYPTVTWDSESTTYVTVSPASSTAVYATDGTATATTTATGGTAGDSICTVRVSGSFTDTGSDRTANVTLTCQDVTDLIFPVPGEGEPYLFRGYYMHPGLLFWNGTSFSLTSGEDPLEILQHFYYDSQITKFDGSSGTAWVNSCYFTWTELPTSPVSANHPGTSTSCSWRIPALTTSPNGGEYYVIYNNPPTYGIKVNSFNDGNPYTDNTANLIHVNVILSDAPSIYYDSSTKTGKGLGRDSDYTMYTAGAESCQAGILLVPDGAYLTCSRIHAVPGNSNHSILGAEGYNVISYEDLEILTSKGCVFLPAPGFVHNSLGWLGGGLYGEYWSSTSISTKNANYFSFTFKNAASFGNEAKTFRMPVKLIRTAE